MQMPFHSSGDPELFILFSICRQSQTLDPTPLGTGWNSKSNEIWWYLRKHLFNSWYYCSLNVDHDSFWILYPGVSLLWKCMNKTIWPSGIIDTHDIPSAATFQKCLPETPSLEADCICVLRTLCTTATDRYELFALRTLWAKNTCDQNTTPFQLPIEWLTFSPSLLTNHKFRFQYPWYDTISVFRLHYGNK